MGSADNFAIEQGKADRAIEWMNFYAKKSNKRFEAKLQGYLLSTIKFGSFEVISWKGDWSSARSVMLKASSKLKIKVLESGYHEKGNLLSSFFGVSVEFAKIYRNGNLVGQIELKLKSGKWIAKSEKSG
ncbi:MAG: hypothetical protein WB443_09505 [Nitrososphaeraceae archaeon]